MSQADKVVDFVIGTSLIAWCFVPGIRFYATGLGGRPSKRTNPKWFGRLWFIVIGLVFVYLALKK
jgi:hypothetical protein